MHRDAASGAAVALEVEGASEEVVVGAAVVASAVADGEGDVVEAEGVMSIQL